METENTVIELTKEQRRIMYQNSYKRFYNGYEGGICNLLYFQMPQKVSIHDFIRNIGAFFPELFKHKPPGARNESYWFATCEERMKVLEECIKETEPLPV